MHKREECLPKEGKPLLENVPKWDVKRAFKPMSWVIGRPPALEEILIEGNPNDSRVKEVKELISTVKMTPRTRYWVTAGLGIAGLGVLPEVDPIGAALVGATVAFFPPATVGYFNYQFWSYARDAILRSLVLEKAVKRSLLHVPPSFTIGDYSFEIEPSAYESSCQYGIYDKKGNMQGRIPYVSRKDPITGEKEIAFLLFHPIKSDHGWLRVLPEFFKALEAKEYLLSIADPSQDAYFHQWERSLGALGGFKRLYDLYLYPHFQGEWTAVRSRNLTPVHLGHMFEYDMIEGMIPETILQESIEAVKKELQKMGIRIGKKIWKEVSYLDADFYLLMVKTRK
ncbi:MAG: hypothetical protein GXN92_00880 [Candidatus Micrarchaeota archaeon]|nr:hypothetical protein [Candidatus Micrarchaeota archaeon]